jgi:hypothetical protein
MHKSTFVCELISPTQNSLTVTFLFQMAISALQLLLFQVGVVTMDDPTFRMLTAAEINEHLRQR